MEGDVRLIWFHADRLADRAAADQVITRLYDWGALHVQCIGSTSRTGGPAFAFTVEVRSADEWRLGDGLARTYGIARYHRIASAYRYQPVSNTERPIVVKREDRQFGLSVRFDVIGTEREPLHVQVKDDDLTRLQDRIAQEWDLRVDPAALRRRLEAMLSDENGFVLEWPVEPTG